MKLKKFSNDIDNFDKISNDKALIKKAKAKLIKLELEMALSEYTSLQEEYTQTHSEIENQDQQVNGGYKPPLLTLGGVLNSIAFSLFIVRNI